MVALDGQESTTLLTKLHALRSSKTITESIKKKVQKITRPAHVASKQANLFISVFSTMRNRSASQARWRAILQHHRAHQLQVTTLRTPMNPPAAARQQVDTSRRAPRCYSA